MRRARISQSQIRPFVVFPVVINKPSKPNCIRVSGLLFGTDCFGLKPNEEFSHPLGSGYFVYTVLSVKFSLPHKTSRHGPSNKRLPGDRTLLKSPGFQRYQYKPAVVSQLRRLGRGYRALKQIPIRL